MTHYKYSILEENKNSPSLIFYHFVDESELDFLKEELKNMREEDKNKKSLTFKIVKRERQNQSEYTIYETK